jgi:hypothetical protein
MRICLERCVSLLLTFCSRIETDLLAVHNTIANFYVVRLRFFEP